MCHERSFMSFTFEFAEFYGGVKDGDPAIPAEVGRLGKPGRVDEDVNQFVGFPVAPSQLLHILVKLSPALAMPTRIGRVEQ